MEKRPAVKHRTVRRLNWVRLTVVLTCLIIAIGSGVVGGLIYYSLKDMPAWNPTALEPNMSSNIYDKNGSLITRIYVENRDPVSFEEIPDTVKSAFLSIEDIRFYEHKGLDIRRIFGALLADIKAGEADQGASTITQQLVKRAFLSPDKTLKRKLQEAFLAIKLERQFTKDEIFELYLNQIYYGEGAYGIQSAAQVYFGKSVKDLTLDEAALLAAIPKGPNLYNPFKKPEVAKNRRNIVLDNMFKYEFISQDQAKEAKNKEIVLNNKKTKAQDIYPYPYFVDYITELLVQKYGENKVYKGGLQVYTSLDPKIQLYSEQILSNPKNFPNSKLDKNGLQQPQAAIVIMDPHTGYIKAMVGGREHKQKRQFNRATDAIRQPGSTFKPIVVYAPAIESGKSPADIVNDSPTSFGSWKVHNYDGQYKGPITYRTALKLSINVAAVKIFNDIGISKGIAFARKLGITSLIDGKDNNLATALGGLTKGVTPLQMAGAYGAFANEGIYVQPTAIIKIEDRDHNIIEQVIPKKTVAMKKTTAFLITNMLQSVVREGTGTNAALGKRPVAGKTGTTSEGKDAWFAGYTPELIGIVWLGHDEPKTMPRIAGGTYPAKIWRLIMNYALKNTPVKEFTKPPGLNSVSICSTSGKLVGPYCPKNTIITDYFIKRKSPTKICDVHTSGAIVPTVNTTKPDGIAICTDPSHGGIEYLANVPGPNQEGGCPPGTVTYKKYEPGQQPTAKCTIPEHQVRPKTPTNPSDPTTESPQTDPVETPTVPITGNGVVVPTPPAKP